MTPDELRERFKYASPEHRRLVDSVRDRLRMSERSMSGRYAQMAKNEERFQAYVPESDVDALRRRRRDSRGKPDYRTVEIPYSYAILMTAHTYYTSVFLSRSPVLQVAGRHGESEMQVQGVEAVLDYQRQVGEWMVPLYIWLLDPGKYGFGVLGHYWDEKYVRRRKIVEQPVTFLGMPIGGSEKVQVVEEIPAYRGNRAYNVRPQDFFPDTRVALRYFQKGEFVARYVEHSWYDVVEGEKKGRFFNIDKLKQMRLNRDSTPAGVLISRESGSRVGALPAGEEIGQTVPVGFVKSYEMYLRVSPKEWKFAPEEGEEVWVVTISANGIVYGIEPLGEATCEFPFDVIEHEPEGYAMFSRSMLEVSQPLTDIMSWLINTHFYNVRQTLNNQFVVDPSMVVMRDVEDPNPGKLIRLKPEAIGRDVRTAITQLNTSDVTRQHIGDINFISEFIQRVTGVTDQTMGMLPTKSHTTATAVRTSTSFGVNRMKTNCEYYSAMGWTPMVQKMIARTQENMDFELYLRIVGDLAQFEKRPFVQVSPDLIAGFFDFVPVDGTLPVDRFAQANLWQMLMGQLQKFPEIMMTYDIAKIFAWVANLAGIKNMTQFRLVPDQAMARQVEGGNVVPLNAAMRDTGMGGPPAAVPNLHEPMQIPGMGSTG